MATFDDDDDDLLKRSNATVRKEPLPRNSYFSRPTETLPILWILKYPFLYFQIEYVAYFGLRWRKHPTSILWSIYWPFRNMIFCQWILWNSIFYKHNRNNNISIDYITHGCKTYAVATRPSIILATFFLLEILREMFEKKLVKCWTKRFARKCDEKCFEIFFICVQQYCWGGHRGSSGSCVNKPLLEEKAPPHHNLFLISDLLIFSKLSFNTFKTC